MANVQHSNLTDPELHEPKGVSTAGKGSVYVADGAGSGDWRQLLLKYDMPVTGTEVSANTTEEHTFTCTGVVAATDMVVGVSKPTHQAGLGIVNARVSADDEVAITYMNTTGSGITPSNETYAVLVYRELP